MKKKLYVETSVWNQIGHADRSDWLEVARLFFQTLNAGLYDPYISTVVIDEIVSTPDERRRSELIEHLNTHQPVALEYDDEAEELAQRYMAVGFSGARSMRVYNDCRHVAVATARGIKHIVSFNCKHLVNDRRIDGFNAINIQAGYDHMIDISTPHKFVYTPEPED